MKHYVAVSKYKCYCYCYLHIHFDKWNEPKCLTRCLLGIQRCLLGIQRSPNQVLGSGMACSTEDSSMHFVSKMKLTLDSLCSLYFSSIISGLRFGAQKTEMNWRKWKWCARLMSEKFLAVDPKHWRTDCVTEHWIVLEAEKWGLYVGLRGGEFCSAKNAPNRLDSYLHLARSWKWDFDTV